MNYTLHQLKIFVSVCNNKSITKASEELHLTQPAVSIQLKKLQDQFELPLTEVISRQLYITDFGNEIARRSKKILEEADAIKYTIDQYKGLLTGKINISVVSTAKYAIPYFLKPFMDKHPKINISIDVSNKEKVVERLTKNETDFAMVSVLPEDVKMNTIELMENRLYLVGNEEQLRDVNELKDIEKLTLLFREKGSATRQAMECFMEDNKISAKKNMELVSNEAIKQAIFAGIGASIVPLIGLRRALDNENIQIKRMPGLPIITNWYLVYLANKKLSPAQLALEKYIQENKAQIVKEHFSWSLSSLDHK